MCHKFIGCHALARAFGTVQSLWRQDTSRARIQVVEPFVGDMRVAQVFDPPDLLPSTIGEERVLQAPESSPARQP